MVLADAFMPVCVCVCLPFVAGGSLRDQLKQIGELEW